jgi:hypothetical protein
MRTWCTFLATAWLATAGGGAATAAEVGPITIAVPEGFAGPATRNLDGGLTVAWVKRRPASPAGTLLQISTVDLGAALDQVKGPDRYEAAKHYLLEFVKGVGQRRDNFQLGDVDRVTLAGLPAARVRWSGSLGNEPAVGVMYCVLVHHSVVSLHTQDAGSELTPAMYSAMSAIDAIQVH